MHNASLTRLRETKLAPAELERITLDGTFCGYASLFGEIDLGNEMILPGAFTASLARRSAAGIRMLYQHNVEIPLGTWKAISEDGEGLRVTGQLATATSKGREVLELMRAGAIDGLSIGYRTIRSRIDKASGARQIVEADLWEISVVTFPMLPGARIETVKAVDAGNKLPTLREFERWLTRDAGLARGDARTIIAKGFAHLAGTRDAAGVPTSLAARIRAAAWRF